MLSGVKYDNLNIYPEKDINIEEGTCIKNYFNIKDEKISIGMKPHPAIWFSCGTWLYDPHHVYFPHKNENIDIDGVKGLFIKNPKNILRITNLLELD